MPRICCNWDLDRPTQGDARMEDGERERRGPISISAAARLLGVPGGPRDLIWRRLWELKKFSQSVYCRRTASQKNGFHTLFMHWIPAPANHCSYYYSSAVPAYCQKFFIDLSLFFLTTVCTSANINMGKEGPVSSNHLKPKNTNLFDGRIWIVFIQVQLIRTSHAQKEERLVFCCLIVWPMWVSYK